MSDRFPRDDDRRPQGIQSDPPRRKAMVLATVAVVLAGTSAIFVMLGIPWWIPVVFSALVFLIVVFAT